MEKTVKIRTENGIITTVDGMPFLEFQLKIGKEVRKKVLKLMQIKSEKFNEMIFQFGCKIESQNTHPNSKGITTEKEFWNWLDHEINTIFFEGLDVLKNKKLTVNNYRAIFLDGIEKFIVQNTINYDLKHLITVEKSNIYLDNVLKSEGFTL